MLCSGNISEIYVLVVDLLSEEVVINVYVFGSGMVFQVAGQHDCELVVNIHINRLTK